MFPLQNPYPHDKTRSVIHYAFMLAKTRESIRRSWHRTLDDIRALPEVQR